MFTTAAFELGETKLPPAFETFYKETFALPARESLAVFAEKLEKLELAASCEDLLLELEARVASEKLEELPALAEFVGEGFRVSADGSERRWDEGPHGTVWEEGGVAWTMTLRSSVARPWFASIVRIEEMPSNCDEAVRAYLERLDVPVYLTVEENYPRIPAGQPERTDCRFVGSPADERRGISGVFMTLRFGHFRIVCEGDARSTFHQGRCSDLVERLLPAQGDEPDRIRFEIPPWRQPS